MTTLGFHDPYAYLRDRIYALGIDDQDDQILYDATEQLTRDQALHLQCDLIGYEQDGTMEEMTPDIFLYILRESQKVQVIMGNTTLQ